METSAPTIVNMHEAKTQLSKLVEYATAGQEIIIARAGKQLVRLTPIVEPAPAPKKRRRLGGLEGLGYTVPDDIKKPFAEDIEKMFYGNPDKFSDL